MWTRECVSTGAGVAYASPGTGDIRILGGHHCPEQGASGQSLNFGLASSDSSFREAPDLAVSGAIRGQTAMVE